MTNEIKEILDKLKNHIEHIHFANLTNYELRLLLDYITNLQEENERLNRRIQIKDAWAGLLIDIGYDYDGYNKAENLKSLIDELIDYADKIQKEDDTTIIYEEPDGKTYNILDEEIKGENK